MSAKTASIISSITTGVLVLLAVLLSFFTAMIALNGYMFSPTAAIAGGLTCMGISWILSIILAWALAKFLISKFNWNNWLAILISILVTSVLGSILSFASAFVVIILTDTLY